ATMIVLPADHHIRYADRFRDTLAQAVALASSGDFLVTIGIEPTAPESGYGYIERGDEIVPGANRVRRFIEKPDRSRAEELVRSACLWNSGIFIWSVAAISRALARHLPEIARELAKIDPSQAKSLAAAYAAIPEQSIDYGVLEKADNVAAIAGDFGWDDIGSWTALMRLGPADADGNVVRGRVLALSSHGNL